VHALLSLPLIHLAAWLLRVPPHVLSVPELRLSSLVIDDAQNYNIGVLAYLALQVVHRTRDERQRAREMDRLLRAARLHGLAMELQPHFLFNTLNGIAALVRSDPRTAERMLVHLSDLLRLTLATGKSGQLYLAEEMKQLQLYLALQQMRHGNRLTVHLDVPAELGGASIPAMLLQPLVENALTHGIGGRPGPGTLTVRAWRDGAALHFTIDDDGVGVPPGGPLKEGIGLTNTRARLAALYPESFDLRVERRAEGGTRVRIRFPYQDTREDLVTA
jgi:LytS/YehU family sensor histidine kinase